MHASPLSASLIALLLHLSLHQHACHVCSFDAQLSGCAVQPFGGQDIEEVLQSMSSDDCQRVWDALGEHVASDFDAESQVTVSSGRYSRYYACAGCRPLLTRDACGRTLST